MIFGALNSEKISHQNLTDLSTLFVRCRHFTLGNPKRLFSTVYTVCCVVGWLDSRVVSVLDSGTEGPAFKSQSRRCQVTVLGKLFTPIVPLFTKLRYW